MHGWSSVLTVLVLLSRAAMTLGRVGFRASTSGDHGRCFFVKLTQSLFVRNIHLFVTSTKTNCKKHSECFNDHIQYANLTQD